MHVVCGCICGCVDVSVCMCKCLLRVNLWCVHVCIVFAERVYAFSEESTTLNVEEPSSIQTIETTTTVTTTTTTKEVESSSVESKGKGVETEETVIHRMYFQYERTPSCTRICTHTYAHTSSHTRRHTTHNHRQIHTTNTSSSHLYYKLITTNANNTYAAQQHKTHKQTHMFSTKRFV